MGIPRLNIKEHKWPFPNIAPTYIGNSMFEACISDGTWLNWTPIKFKSNSIHKQSQLGCEIPGARNRQRTLLFISCIHCYQCDMQLLTVQRGQNYLTGASPGLKVWVKVRTFLLLVKPVWLQFAVQPCLLHLTQLFSSFQKEGSIIQELRGRRPNGYVRGPWFSAYEE